MDIENEKDRTYEMRGNIIRKTETTIERILTNRNRELTFLRHITSKEDLEKVIHTGHIQGKRGSRNQLVNLLNAFERKVKRDRKKSIDT